MPQPFEEPGVSRPQLNVAQDQDPELMRIPITHRCGFGASLPGPGDLGHRTETHRTTKDLPGTHSVNPSWAKTPHREFHLSNTNLLFTPGAEAVAPESSGIDDSSYLATMIESRGTPSTDDGDQNVMVP
ncbi:hypothetical protein ACIF80_16860 [Streptomyces sp. NPDC085927]|uniref:hypothetical protein n=1 Tax=Streptomyces sp. NPDC085927 TaxID=3365738 RepID=UPI0037D34CD8